MSRDNNCSTYNDCVAACDTNIDPSKGDSSDYEMCLDSCALNCKDAPSPYDPSCPVTADIQMCLLIAEASNMPDAYCTCIEVYGGDPCRCSGVSRNKKTT